MTTLDLKLLTQELIKKLREKNLKIAFAESMTGGLLAATLTEENDASKVFGLGLVTYSEEAKMSLLKCKKETIEKYSVYSKPVIKEMIEGLKMLTDAKVLVAVSGVAGPNKPDKLEVGEVYIGFLFEKELMIEKKIFSGNRNLIQAKTVRFVFKRVINKIK